MLPRSLLRRRFAAAAPTAPPASAPVAMPSPLWAASSAGACVYALPPCVLLVSDMPVPAATPAAPLLPLPSVVEGFLCAEEVLPHPLYPPLSSAISEPVSAYAAVASVGSWLGLRP
jgi:hypothetical protein